MFSNVPGTKIIQNTAGSGDVVYQVYCVQNAAAAAPITLEIMNSPPFKITGPPGLLSRVCPYWYRPIYSLGILQ